MRAIALGEDRAGEVDVKRASGARATFAGKRAVGVAANPADATGR